MCALEEPLLQAPKSFEKRRGQEGLREALPLGVPSDDSDGLLGDSPMPAREKPDWSLPMLLPLTSPGHAGPHRISSLNQRCSVLCSQQPDLNGHTQMGCEKCVLMHTENLVPSS